jgi:hypothetical protein
VKSPFLRILSRTPNARLKNAGKNIGQLHRLGLIGKWLSRLRFGVLASVEQAP